MPVMSSLVSLSRLLHPRSVIALLTMVAHCLQPIVRDASSSHRSTTSCQNSLLFARPNSSHFPANAWINTNTDGSDFMGERLKVQFARGSRAREPGYGANERAPPRPRRTPYRMQITGLPPDTSWQVCLLSPFLVAGLSGSLVALSSLCVDWPLSYPRGPHPSSVSGP